MTADLFRAHIETIAQRATEALTLAAANGEAFDGIVFHAGTDGTYHADDRHIPFRSAPHFRRWAPVPGPEHLLVFRPGARVRLVQVVPRDFWYGAPVPLDHPFGEVLELITVGTAAQARAAVDAQGLALIGDQLALAQALGLPPEAYQPPTLLAALDWDRAAKTPYEIECVRAAGELAAKGHAAVRAGVADGLSERQLHAAYLSATGAMEHDTPYGNIIAWDEAAATLHYTRKRTTAPTPGHVFLIDAGAESWGYASDVTRTYTRPGAHPVFVELLRRMDTLQRSLVDRVGPGQDYVALHAHSVHQVGAMLCELDILRTDADTAYAKKLAHLFLPHGLGHHLGLQVHDVGGHQAGRHGGRVDPPSEHAFLRTTRTMEVGHVLTIEPGLYFIPMLLDPVRSEPRGASINWPLVDQLVPCGGIRIEDDIAVSESGREDLTRPFIPGA